LLSSIACNVSVYKRESPGPGPFTVRCAPSPWRWNWQLEVSRGDLCIFTLDRARAAPPACSPECDTARALPRRPSSLEDYVQKCSVPPHHSQPATRAPLAPLYGNAAYSFLLTSPRLHCL